MRYKIVLFVAYTLRDLQTLDGLQRYKFMKLSFPQLHIFDNYIRNEPGRRAVLLEDNCEAHGKIGTLPTLKNVEV